VLKAADKALFGIRLCQKRRLIAVKMPKRLMVTMGPKPKSQTCMSLLLAHYQMWAVYHGDDGHKIKF